MLLLLMVYEDLSVKNYKNYLNFQSIEDVWLYWIILIGIEKQPNILENLDMIEVDFHGFGQ